MALFLTAAMALCGIAPAAVNGQEPAFESNPFAEIVLEMRVAHRRLGKLDTGKPTQVPQSEAVRKLDALIAELEKECANCRGQRAARNPSRPAQDSTVRSGPGGMGDLHGPREQGDRWGELPPHERDRILQSLTEGFPPHYQAILEAYYKRLADEKPVQTEELPKPNQSKSQQPPPATSDVAPKK